MFFIYFEQNSFKAYIFQIFIPNFYLVMQAQYNLNIIFESQSAFTCSKLTKETLEQGVRYVQS